MALTPTQRKRQSRARRANIDKKLGVKHYTMELTARESESVDAGAQAGGYEDKTEYLLALVRADRDTSQKGAV
jgi:hypothetical protein